MTLEEPLGDLKFLYGDGKDEDEPPYISYGDKIKLWVAPKEGKANTLLADQLFSPSLLFAERIERGLLPLAGKTVIELGAGAALPSMLACTIPEALPSLVTITDYPDPTIMGNLRRSVEFNRRSFSSGCTVNVEGYEWGSNVDSLLGCLPNREEARGYDIVILSDLLHFEPSHSDLVRSIGLLLSRSRTARVYVGAGRYTSRQVCQKFLDIGKAAGFEWEEGENDGIWHGEQAVGSWTRDELGLRKANVQWWIGKWV